MASSGKKKTTFAKLAREHKLRERRLDKAAKKNARKQASENPPGPLGDVPAGLGDATAAPSDAPAGLGDAPAGLGDAPAGDDRA